MKETPFINLPTVGLLVIKNNKLLLAYSKNKKAWYLPGGKVDFGETSIEALTREIKEELNIILEPSLISFFCHIQAPAYGEKSNVIMEQDCYLYQLEEEAAPTNEIEAVKYFDLEAYLKESEKVVGVIEVFSKLYNDRLLVNL